MSQVQVDNSTLERKVALRREALRRIQGDPVIMETHAGTGRIYLDCYTHVSQGVAMEKVGEKVETLVRQRPTWSIYEGDSETIVAGGGGSHLPVNYLDVDPYGAPWPVIQAFFASDRPFPNQLTVVVFDGMRQKVKWGAWVVECLRPMVLKYGSDFSPIYLDVAKDFLGTIAGERGYRMRSWAGFYSGKGRWLSNYSAVLER